jgi:hypothetical protein
MNPRWRANWHTVTTNHGLWTRTWFIS